LLPTDETETELFADGGHGLAVLAVRAKRYIRKRERERGRQVVALNWPKISPNEPDAVVNSCMAMQRHCKRVTNLSTS